MRARYYYNRDTGFAYKVAGDGACPAKLDVNMWEPMDILGAGVILYLGN